STASMYLAPVVIVSLWLGRDDVPVWSYLVSFVAAIAASVLYFYYDDPARAKLLGPLFGYEHKYTKLLILCAGVFATGLAAFALGIAAGPRRSRRQDGSPHAASPSGS
ncbi:MAG: hypothetical protein AB7J19_07205, partial [Beijerinckiaceae bacterium]